MKELTIKANNQNAEINYDYGIEKRHRAICLLSSALAVSTLMSLFA